MPDTPGTACFRHLLLYRRQSYVMVTHEFAIPV